MCVLGNHSFVWRFTIGLLLIALVAQTAWQTRGEAQESRLTESPVTFRSELLFAPQPLHNHGSCVVEMPGGGLFACWYRGSGERSADDVAVMGSRLAKRAVKWETPFVLSDTPEYPDTNPCLYVDPHGRLWLFHSVILNNEWSSAISRYKVSADYRKLGRAPTWLREDLLLFKPGPEFKSTVDRDLTKLLTAGRPASTPEMTTRIEAYANSLRAKAGDKLAVRLGWMTRAHPTLIQTRAGVQRLLVPLYSDNFSFSLVARTDDWGAHWQVSAPIVGAGNVQPSIVQRRDGTLVAFMRDNGPPPKRIIQSDSADEGQTWSMPRDLALPDPGAGLEALVLRSGRWLLVNNDTERGRNSLAVTVSEDEGRTWAFKKHIEHDLPDANAGSYSYPSIIQARDGSIHVTYSYRGNKTDAARLGLGETIKHITFDEAWLLAPTGRVPL